MLHIDTYIYRASVVTILQIKRCAMYVTINSTAPCLLCCPLSGAPNSAPNAPQLCWRRLKSREPLGDSGLGAGWDADSCTWIGECHTERISKIMETAFGTAHFLMHMQWRQRKVVLLQFIHLPRTPGALNQRYANCTVFRSFFLF